MLLPAALDSDEEPVSQDELHRLIAMRARLHMVCRRPACRRGRACAEAKAPCFAEFLPLLREFVFPAIRAEVLKARGLPPEPPQPPRSLASRIDAVVDRMMATDRRRSAKHAQPQAARPSADGPSRRQG